MSRFLVNGGQDFNTFNSVLTNKTLNLSNQINSVGYTHFIYHSAPGGWVNTIDFCNPIINWANASWHGVLGVVNFPSERTVSVSGAIHVHGLIGQLVINMNINVAAGVVTFTGIDQTTCNPQTLKIRHDGATDVGGGWFLAQLPYAFALGI